MTAGTATLRERIDASRKAAMKARDAERLGTVRMLWNAIRNAEIDTRTELGDEQITGLLMTEVKKRKESADAYRAGNRPELAAQEEREAEILGEFLPAAPDEHEISVVVAAVVAELQATSMRDMGKVMRAVRARLGAAADGRTVSAIVKGHLGGG